jgi:hypothetical protein
MGVLVRRYRASYSIGDSLRVEWWIRSLLYRVFPDEWGGAMGVRGWSIHH